MGLTDIQYKESETGVIPVDWEVKKLCEISVIATGNTPPTNDPSNYGDEFLFVSPADLGKGKWITQTEKKLSRKGFSISRKFPKNSILFTCIGSTIGKSGMAHQELTSNQQINAVLPSSKYSYDFIFYALDYISPRIKSIAGEQAVPIVNKTLFGETLLAVPHIKSEQTAIATALTDADTLIENLEKLIEKKRNIKQGLMQELLTGRNRLAEFDGKWEEKRLGEIIKLQGGYAFKSEQFQDNNGIPIIRISNIDNNTIDLSDVVYYPEFDIPAEFVIKKDDVLIAMSGATTGKIGIYRFPFHSYQNQRVGKFVLKNAKANDLNFVSHLVNSENFKSSLQKEIAQGAQPNISSKQIESIVLNIPTDIKEQTTIANYLSDVESEIETLRNKTIKLRMIKQGMMQALLTGKIRLV